SRDSRESSSWSSSPHLVNLSSYCTSSRARLPAGKIADSVILSPQGDKLERGAIQPQHMHVAVLADGPDELAIGIVHQAHRVIEAPLGDGIDARYFCRDPAVLCTLVEEPGHRALSIEHAAA